MTDHGIERIVSIILRSGVLISGTVVLLGGVIFLTAHGRDRGLSQLPRAAGVRSIGSPNRRWSICASRSLNHPVRSSFADLDSDCPRSLFARRLCSRARQTYVVITIVLGVLLYSLIAGAFGSA